MGAIPTTRRARGSVRKAGVQSHAALRGAELQPLSNRTGQPRALPTHWLS